MKKYILDLKVTEKLTPHANYVLLKLTDPNAPLPKMGPGQFAELRVDGSKTTFLRRPISINKIDYARNEIWLLIQFVGDGTRALGNIQVGDIINCVLPLGNTFTTDFSEVNDPKSSQDLSLLLVGGGVGIAPMLYLGTVLKEAGYKPVFLLGARSASDILELDEFAALGEVFTTTEDASHGEKGFVTQHSILEKRSFDRVFCCGPKPMMQAVARFAATKNIPCEVSLENKMACGVGACLCCVEDTKEGHKCVCSEGPVFLSADLKW